MRRSKYLFCLILFGGGLLLGLYLGHHRGKKMVTIQQETPLTSIKIIKLPEPDQTGSIPFETILKKRRSIRDFQQKKLSIRKIGQLLWAAGGVTGADGKRTAPSAGATYPITLYLITKEGFYHYHPENHTLHLLKEGDLRKTLYQQSYQQKLFLKGAITILLTGNLNKIAPRYGIKSRRYIDLEAGHIAQNIYLQGAALGLGFTAVGAFDAPKLQQSLHLPKHQEPIYLITGGVP